MRNKKLAKGGYCPNCRQYKVYYQLEIDNLRCIYCNTVHDVEKYIENYKLPEFIIKSINHYSDYWELEENE